ncbi:MAG: tripartite tricarboxylate transporter TctB family protein [Hyphomicrobiales bacterium]|nr:tripartite tricarboxylate transporter TctB family protein [Hyphomicrobiales bacterium]
MKGRAADAVYALAILLACGLLFVETRSDYYADTGIGFNSSSVFYPKILIALLALLGLVLLAQGLVRRRGAAPAPAPAPAADTAETTAAAVPLARRLAPLAVVLGLTTLFAALFARLPFLATSIPYSLLLGYLLGYRRLVFLVPTGVGVPVAVALVFEHLLGIPLP